MFRVKPNFKRRPPRLSRVFNDRPLYFITFCTHQRKPFLACDEVHAAFAVFAKRAETSFNVAVGRYVIMPDHIHLFVRGADDFRLGHWIALLKQVLGKASENAPMAGRIFRSRFKKQRGLCTKMELRSSESRARRIG